MSFLGRHRLRVHVGAAVQRRSAGLATTAIAPTPQAPLLLDGGMGHELRRLGVEIAGPIGSQQRFLSVALANMEQPQLVRTAHMNFLAAGADVITTNNYAVVPNTLAISGGRFNDSDLELLVRESALRASEAVQATLEAAEAPRKRPLVAGSLPPLTASYRPDLVPADANALVATYTRIAATLVPHVDVLLCETMSCAREAQAAAAAAVKVADGRPVWVAWTLMEDQSARLRSGESVQDAVKALCTAGLRGRIAGALFNCTDPASVRAALPPLTEVLPSLTLEASAEPIAIGGYANGFHTANSDGKGSDYNEDLTPSAYAEEVEGWLGVGASIVGGCCGIFPQHIAEIRRRLG